MSTTKEVIVIGGGPGGYVAAIRAAQLGGNVTLIEKNNLGGTCLNVGCIPTKVLLHTADLLDEAKRATEFGIDLMINGYDWKKVLRKKNETIQQLERGINSLLKANKIKLVNGTASFVSKNTLAVTKMDGTTEEIKGDKIIVATGSVPITPPIPGINENDHCIYSTEALNFTEVPKSLLVVGGGVIGVEFASMYSRFGTKVTIIESLPTILPQMDGELAQHLKKQLEKSGIKIFTNAEVVSVQSSTVGAKVNVKYNGEVISFETEKVLIAVGRKANTESLNMDRAKIANDHGNIIVNDKMETNVKNIFAIGDCLGQVMLAHVAATQGEIAAENAMGLESSYDDKTIPFCIYTNPEFAGVGLTEEQAKNAGMKYETGHFPLQANGKAQIMNGGQGIVKVIIGKEYKEILGVHILGPRATDIIAQCALAIGLEATIEDIIATIHPHPTIAESVREVAMAVEKHPIHTIL